jgi:Pyruvate phosphate dikinase, PEP/pyruvate binding domain.
MDINSAVASSDTTIHYFMKDSPPVNAALTSVGGKAHSLIRMVELQLPVPPGFVLPVEFSAPGSPPSKGRPPGLRFSKPT